MQVIYKLYMQVINEIYIYVNTNG